MSFDECNELIWKWGFLSFISRSINLVAGYLLRPYVLLVSLGLLGHCFFDKKGMQCLCLRNRDTERKCQLTRPSIFSDRLSKIYYFSPYFTWLLLKLKFSSNKVTLLSGVVCLAAGYLFFIGDHYFSSFWQHAIGAFCYPRHVRWGSRAIS